MNVWVLLQSYDPVLKLQLTVQLQAMQHDLPVQRQGTTPSTLQYCVQEQLSYVADGIQTNSKASISCSTAF